MLLVELAEPYPGRSLLEMAKAFARQRCPSGAEWFISTNGPDIFHTPYPFPCHLFRGQNQHFMPCAPSISRGLAKYSTTIGGMDPSDQAKVIVRISKSHWFAHEMDKHPAAIWAKENRYTLNRLGLAQHYELETNYVDLSHNFNVAAFFATCRFQNGTWEPLVEGVGVIYVFDLAKSQRCSFKAEPVSLQPLPRPGEQGAWLVEVPLGADFESHPAVSWIKFQHEETASRYFWELFDGGKTLFPDDPIARVAAKIKHSSAIDERIVDNIIDQLNGVDLELETPGLLKEYIGKDINLERSQKSFIEEEDLSAIALQWQKRAATFGKNCTTRPIALQIIPNSKDPEIRRSKDRKRNSRE